jgi:hypothetical protein
MGRGLTQALLVAAGVVGAGAAWGQEGDMVWVSLARQDFSDCQNRDVKPDPNMNGGGIIGLFRDERSGTTELKVALALSPNTTYQFFLKCVRQLGELVTDDEGIAVETFSFPTRDVGDTYAFDMYPSGAPAGNKFQSLTVHFP